MTTPATDIKRCRFCRDEAIGRFSMSAGCVCFPDDREQDLCMQHVIRATPLDDMELIADYTLNRTFTWYWTTGQW